MRSNPQHEWNESLAEAITVAISDPSVTPRTRSVRLCPLPSIAVFNVSSCLLEPPDSLLLHSDWLNLEQLA